MSKESVRECAGMVMGTIPLVMRDVVSEMQKLQPADISMLQFRVLMFIKHHKGASLSLVAEHHGATLSSTSKLVDGLAERGYVTRDTAPDDRRRVTLALTELGEAQVKSVHRASISYLGERLAALPDGACSTIMTAMRLLRSAFGIEETDAVLKRQGERL